VDFGRGAAAEGGGFGGIAPRGATRSDDARPGRGESESVRLAVGERERRAGARASGFFFR